MEPRDAIKILIEMRKKYSFDSQEDQAVLMATGVLDSAALSKNRIRGILAKRKSNQLGIKKNNHTRKS